MESAINTVLYLGLGEYISPNKKVHYCAGASGYTYDVGVEGKKKLQKNTPTTTGYYTGGTGGSTNVVIPIDIISVTYCHAKSNFEGVLNIIVSTLEHISKMDKPGNLAIISTVPGLERLINLSPKTVRDNQYKFGRIELDEPIVKAVENIQQLLSDLKDTKLWFNDTLLAEGGLGSKMLVKETSMAEVLTQWSGEAEICFDVTPLKEYENPESDLNKIISASRWYFNTGTGSDFYDPVEGYRAYYFGKVERDKKYYGKVTPDVTYSAFYSKQPVEYLDNLFNFARRMVKNPKELLLAGNMQYMTSKDIVRLNNSHPAVKSGKDLIVPFKVGAKDDATLIELIDPPALSYLIVEDNFEKNIILKAFLNKDENNCYGEFQSFVDITDLIYEKETNKKGVVKLKLNNEFRPATTVFVIDAKHRCCAVPIKIMLSVGYDMPDRNSFNSVEDTDVQVWCSVDSSNEKCLTYRTLVVTKDWIYIHSGAKGTNIRVLNKKELESFKA